MGCGDGSFVKSGMRQLNPACDIPARINMRDVCLHMLVDMNPFPVILDSDMVKLQIISPRLSADGDETSISLNIKAVIAIFQKDALPGRIKTLHLYRCENTDAGLLETCAKKGGNIRIFLRQNLFRLLGYDHVRSQPAVYTGKFTADDSSADNKNRFRDGRQ